MTNYRFVFPLLAGALVLSAPGCGSGPRVVSAKRTVLYQGTPVAGATLTFSPKGEKTGPVINGVTDAEGHFSLKTYVGATSTGDGAMPGEYRVAISKFVPPKGMTEDE